MSISRNPRASIPRRGRINSLISGHNSRRRSDELFRGVFGVTLAGTIVLDASHARWDAFQSHTRPARDTNRAATARERYHAWKARGSGGIAPLRSRLGAVHYTLVGAVRRW